MQIAQPPTTYNERGWSCLDQAYLSPSSIFTRPSDAMSRRTITKSLMLIGLLIYLGCARQPEISSNDHTASHQPKPQSRILSKNKPLQMLRRGNRTKIDWSTSRVDPKQLAKAIRLATSYLNQACQPSGQFTYCVHQDKTQELKPEYNILRHAGTLYALEMSYERSPDSRTREVLLKAARFLRKETLAPLERQPDLLAIWSLPEMNHSGQPAQAKLGGAGLGLVALVGMEQLHPGFSELAELRGLASFIRSMQRPDGSFYSKYFRTTGPDATWHSLYYPGEAALGLLNLYKIDADERWLQAASAALIFLARSQQQSPSVRPDHWMLLAAKQLKPILERDDSHELRAELMQHVRRTCKRMAEDQRPFLSNPLLRGCFVEDGRTTPTSIRLEGLLAALNILDANDYRLEKQLDEVVAYGIQYLLRCQVQSGPLQGGIPCAISFIPTGDAVDDAELKRRAGEIRIDYVQHALSAMIQYEQWVTRE